MQPSLIHLEHALPALAELGIESLVPLLGGQGLNPASLGVALQGLAHGAEVRSARMLVAISASTAEELLTWEANPDAKARALQHAALLPFEDAKQAVLDFFSSLGLSQATIPASSKAETETPPEKKSRKRSVPVH